MGRHITIEEDELVVRLDGWNAVAAVKRELRVPLEAVTRVSTGSFDDDGWRLVGTAIPFTDVRAGRFRRRGRRQFLSFGTRDALLIVEADRSRGAPYDVVAIELPDPERAAALVEQERRRVAA